MTGNLHKQTTSRLAGGNRLRRWRDLKLVFLVEAGAAIAAGFPFVVALGYPDYDHASQFISELGAVGSPVALIARIAGFLPAGLFLCAGLGLVAVDRRLSVAGRLGALGLILFAAGYLVAVVVPCDAGCPLEGGSVRQNIHNALGSLGYFVAPLALILIGASFLTRRHIALASGFFSLALAALTGLILLALTAGPPGLAQRGLEYAVLLGCVALVRTRSELSADKVRLLREGESSSETHSGAGRG